MKTTKCIGHVITNAAVGALLSLTMCSCAYLINGTKQEIHINSNPSGADISINGIPHGRTPTSVSLERSGTHLVQITRDEYMPTSRTIGHCLSGWFWPDIFCDTIPGLVDLCVGSAYRLEPETLNVQLNKVQSGSSVVPSGTAAPASFASDSATYSLATFRVVSYTYDAKTQKGVISVDVSGHDFEKARNWVIKNIGAICSSKELLMEAGQENNIGGRYRVMNESFKDGILTIEFTAGF